MPDSPKTEAVPATLDVTLQIPFDQLLASYTERLPAYSGDPDDWQEAPPRVLDVISERVAQILAAEQRDEVRKMVKSNLSATINEQVVRIVSEAMEAPLQPTNDFGSPRGPVTTLTEVIQKQATDWLTKAPGYDRQTAFQKFLAAEVDKAIKADLTGALAAARAQVTQRLRDSAAEAITKTITGSLR